MPKKPSRNQQKSARRKTTTAYGNKSPFSKLGWLAALILIIGSALHLTGWRLFIDNTRQLQLAQVTQVSGTVHFTALKPDPTDRGNIYLLAKENGTSKWQIVNKDIQLAQDANWLWKDALPGVVYDLKAQLVIDNEPKKESAPITVVAPAHNTELELEVNWHDLPDDVVKDQSTNLGGEVTVNGFIPANSSLEVYLLNAPDAAHEITQLNPTALRYVERIAIIDNPQDINTWLWTEAEPRASYEVIVALRANGQTIIAPQLVIADAGEESLSHQVNSPFQPNVRGVTTAPSQRNNLVSGLVRLQGPQDKNTSLLMLWRKPGESDYKVINRYQSPAHAGTSWSWDGAEVGQQYEIMSALQVNDKNTSTAMQPALITAPARNVDFTLNTYYVLPATNNSPSLHTCLDRTSVNTWTALLDVPAIPNAGNYWVQVGDNTNNMGGVYNQMYSAAANPDGMQIKVGDLQNGKQYFIRYSYSSCVNCSNTNDFAPFSPTVGFTCQ